MQLDALELTDVAKYANKFGSYRNVSVWSPPEALRQPRKVMDADTAMDVYSFGLIVWQVLHECVPFDGKIKECSKLVLDQDCRPKILQMEDEVESPEPLEVRSDKSEQPKGCCTGPIADLIRRCWVSDPAKRPGFDQIVEELTKEVAFYKTVTTELLGEMMILDSPSDDDTCFQRADDLSTSV